MNCVSCDRVSISFLDRIGLNGSRRTSHRHYAGKILIQRDESTPEKLPKLFYSKLPHDIASR